MILVFVGTLLSGCAGPDEGDDERDVGKGDPVGEATAAPAILLEDCTEVLLRSSVPATWAEPFVPPGFHMSLAPALADVFVNIFDCDRIVGNTTVDENTHWFEISLTVQKDFDEGEDPFPELVLGSFSDSRALISAFAAEGIEVENAEIDRRNEPMLNGLENLDWTIQGNDHSFHISLVNGTWTSGQAKQGTDKWYAGPPLTLAIINGTYEAPAGRVDQSVEMTLEGDDELAQLFGGTDRWHFIHNLRWNAHYSVSIRGRITL